MKTDQVPSNSERSTADQPLVSVVIPYFNNPETIGRAVESVFAQTYPNIEVLIVDDGSEKELPPDIICMDPERITIERHAINRGAAAARNTGIKSSKGRYVAFLDADDSWRPEKLARQLQVLTNTHTNVKSCVCGFSMHRPNKDDGEIHDYKLKNDIIQELLWGCRLSPGSTMVCERQCFDTVGFYREDLRRLEDWEWFLRFASYYRLVQIPGVWVDIFVSQKSDVTHVDDVIHATRLIRAQHLATVSRLGRVSRRIFLSALEVEKAAAHYRASQKWMAILIVFRSLLIWPFRNLRFFRRLVDCVVFAPGLR